MRRLPFVALAAALLVVPLSPAPAQAPVPDPVLVAVLDTGIDPAHPEFATGQIKGWKDFTSQNSATPIDTHGHGTATASLVAGLNVGGCSNVAKKSFASGTGLLIARVAVGSAVDGDVNAAIRWAVAQGADVISMSFGADIPVFAAASQAEVRAARNAGVMLVASAGNGVRGFGLVPEPAWAVSLSSNIEILSVGSGTSTGGTLLSTTGNHDPDVTSWGDNVCVAIPGGGYAVWSGTSFSAPFVAGMAAHAIEVARAHGKANDPARITDVLIYNAKNSAFSPYAREGLGFLLDAAIPRIEADAAAGTTTAQMIAEYDAQGTTGYEPTPSSPNIGHAGKDRIYRDNFVRLMKNTLP